MIKVQDLVNKFQYALDNKWGYIWGKSGVLWTAEMQKDAASAENAREQTIKYGERWIGHYVADCSGLFHWAFKQLGGYMYHGSNTMYTKYCVKNGLLKDLNKPIPGMAVFKYSSQYTNPYYHVGLYIGDDVVIEAKGTYYGVTTSKLSEWSHWGWLKGVEEPTEGIDISPSSTDTSYPVVQYGSRNAYVTELQNFLMSLGYSVGKKGADGIFGKDTKAGVVAFQADHGLETDGIVGSNTWKCLLDECSKVANERYTVQVADLTYAQMKDIQIKYPNAEVWVTDNNVENG